jgi:hypothetical protein
MKTTSKITTVLVALGALAFNANAQTSMSGTPDSKSIRYSIGVESGLATGGFHDAHNWNIGGSLQADFPIASSLFITANAGYNNFFSKDNAGYAAADLHLIPVKAGLKYFPLNKVYVQGEAGAAFAVNKAEAGIDRTAGFIYAPQIGVLIPLGSKNGIDAGVRYEGSTQFDGSANNSKVNFFGIRVAYAFGL